MQHLDILIAFVIALLANEPAQLRRNDHVH